MRGERDIRRKCRVNKVKVGRVAEHVVKES